MTSPAADDGVGQAPGTGPAARVTDFGPEWVRRGDGLLYRTAARVILFDGADRLLLVRGHDMDRPERSWWFTLGGGIDAGETARQAAVREVHEESGLVLDPGALIGPVLTRSAEFDFYAETVRQDEEFFVARVDDPGPVVTDHWTQVEQGFMDEIRWWDLDGLAAVEVEVFPAGLPSLAADLLDGWDGVTRHLGLARD